MSDNEEIIIEQDHARDSDTLSIIRDCINMANEGLRDGESVDDFCGVLTKIKDAMIPATTYQMYRRRRQVRRP